MDVETIKEEIEKHFDYKVDYIQSSSNINGSYDVQMVLIKKNCKLKIDIDFKQPANIVEELSKIIKTSKEQDVSNELKEGEE